ncbi:MAG: PQQ-binding-like beta-propeller repeat protein, partial [Thaumarchaeota archaeon]|nr:PQQ-binding-like beta-propeller repeat protein [Nitrososphaerota archaeon]
MLSVSVIAILVSSTILIALSILAVPVQAQQQNLSGSNMGLTLGKDWWYTNANQWGQGYQPQNQMTKDNIQFLEMKWIYPWPAAPGKVGGYPATSVGATASPLVVNGILYVLDNACSVNAFDLATGKLLWKFTPKLDFDRDSKAGILQYMLPNTGCPALPPHAFSYFEGKLYYLTVPCTLHIVDALTGSLKGSIGPLCTPEAGIEGNTPPPLGSRYTSGYSYPPVFDQKRRVMIVPTGMTQGVNIDKGRGFFQGYNVDTLQKLWTLYVCPRMDRNDRDWQQQMLRLRSEGKIWFHVGPFAGDSQPGRGINARDIPESFIAEDWGMFSERFPGRIDNRRVTGFAGTCTGAGWSHWSVDEDEGTVILTTNQMIPDWNATFRPGPNLLGESIFKVDVMTGKILWVFQAGTRGLHDFECSWNNIIGFADVPGRGRTKLVIKGCKTGTLQVLDHATGEPIPWVNGNPWEPPVVKRSKHTRLNDPRSFSDLFERNWANWPDKGPFIQQPPGSGGFESDLAYDPVRQTIYGGAYYLPACTQVLPVDQYAVSSRSSPAREQCWPDRNFPVPEATFYAIEAGTGKIKWEFNVQKFGFRGGVTLSGDMVIFNMVDGNLRFLDADTGKLVMQRYMGNGMSVAPIIAADANGKMRLITYVGGPGAGGYGSTFGPTPGALVVSGLPEVLPKETVITKEIIKEAPKEVLKEALKELPKDVLSEVAPTQETISPISYAIVGIGVIMLVV